MLGFLALFRLLLVNFVASNDFFDRLRYATAYRETVPLTEVPASGDGVLADTPAFRLEARRLSHPVETFGYRLVEPDGRAFRLTEEALVVDASLGEVRR